VTSSRNLVVNMLKEEIKKSCDKSGVQDYRESKKCCRNDVITSLRFG